MKIRRRKIALKDLYSTLETYNILVCNLLLTYTYHQDLWGMQGKIRFLEFATIFVIKFLS